MADTGAPFFLPYVEGADLVRDYPNTDEAFANKVEDYLLYKESRTVTGSATLAIGDTNRVVASNSGSATTITVPANATVAFPIGSLVGVFNLGSGTVTVAGAAGVTVRNAGTVSQFSEISLRKRGTNEWVMV